MMIQIHLDSAETFSNIGLAKAIVESSLSTNDVQELAQYLMIYSENNPTEKGGAE